MIVAKTRVANRTPRTMGIRTTTQYKFNIKYRKGTLNKVVDALSRQPTIANIVQINCPWYQRQWQTTQNTPGGARLPHSKLLRYVLHQLGFKDTAPEEQWKECVPKNGWAEILSRYHDYSTAGHLGIAKTIARIASHYY